MRGTIKVMGVISVMLLVVIAGVITYRSNIGPEGKRIDILHAGSMIFTLQDLGPKFESETGYSIASEGHGSVQASNMIKEGQRNPDVFVSASSSVIEPLIVADLADWWITFATDELVIAYLDGGKFTPRLDKAREGIIPWYEVLTEDGFKFGRTDPELDPKGFRCIIMVKLAEEHYNESGLGSKLLGRDRNPEQVLPEETLQVHLELGMIHAIIAYRHEAVERGMRFIELPPEINLGNEAHKDAYSKAYYKTLDGEKRHGSLIEFAFTIPKRSMNPKGAVIFCDYLLSDKGSKFIEEHGFTIPQELGVGGDKESIPTKIRDHLE